MNDDRTGGEVVAAPRAEIDISAEHSRLPPSDQRARRESRSNS
jgi:hypothetical protein